MRLPAPPSGSSVPVTERWADASRTYGESNPRRAREVADKLIAFGVASVLDIGCGNMKIREFLAPAGIGYVPADVVQRSPDCLVVDLDKDEVPQCDAECAIVIGVLEFLADPAAVVERLSRIYPRLLVTLSPLQTIYDQVWHGRPHTIACSHASAISLPDFKTLVSRFYVIEDVDIINTGQYLVLARSKATSKSPLPVAAATADDGIAANVVDFDRLAGTFETHIFKSVPFHGVFLRTAALAASTVVRPGSVCVDLGCSTGRFARLLRRRLAEVVPLVIVAVDMSADMIALARGRDDSPHTNYVRADLTSYDIPATAAFISCLFTLQFLSIEDRKAVLAKIHAALEWRGCAVVAEKVVEADGHDQMSNHQFLNTYKHMMGLTDDEIMAKERAVRSTLHPLRREANLALFAEAGFARVQVIVSVFGWELYLLRKT